MSRGDRHWTGSWEAAAYLLPCKAKQHKPITEGSEREKGTRFSTYLRMPRYCSHGLGFLPACFTALCTITVIITYIIAVSKGHVSAFLPTISETGLIEPESNVFSLLLSLGSFLGFLTIVVRYVQYNSITEYNEQEQRTIIKVNKLGVIVGVITCIGGAIVASFQAEGSSLSGHLTGAAFTFAGGVFYMLTNTYLSWKMVRCGVNTRKLCSIRILLTFMATTSLILCVVSRYLADKQWESGKNHDKRHWQPEDGGYSMHLVSSINEWVTALLVLAYFLTFCGEFEKITFDFRVKRRNFAALPFETSGEDRNTPLIT
eukprot:gene7331-8150_t